ncbi:hypothetical protein V7075_09555 [Neobacillus drentensis]|uniref:hypothetical protein n=1 Tax=Neobacillus drentensis TaxID=220684 RepID=UPI00300081F2
MVEVKTNWTNIMRDEKIEPKDRLKASEYIAKTNAAFIDNQEVHNSITETEPIPDLDSLSVEELQQLESLILKATGEE